MIEFGVVAGAAAARRARPRGLRPVRRRRPLVGRHGDRRRAASRPRSTSARAVWALRVGAGVALIVVAFAEKLANPRPGARVPGGPPGPQRRPARSGCRWATCEFIRVAGAIEVLFGLLLISGALPQAIVLIAGDPVQRVAVVLRRRRAARAPAGLRGDAGAARLRLGPRSCAPAVPALWPWTGRAAARELGRDARARREAALAGAAEPAVRQAATGAPVRRRRGPGGRRPRKPWPRRPCACRSSLTVSVSVIASPPVGLKVTLSV